MDRIKSFFIRLIGKRIEGKLEAWGISKAKLTAIVGVIIMAIDKLGPAFGHPIVIPPDVYKVLEFLGLWAVRDAIDSSQPSV